MFSLENPLKKFKDDGGQSPIDVAIRIAKFTMARMYQILQKFTQSLKNNISEEINNINDLTKTFIKRF